MSKDKAGFFTAKNIAALGVLIALVVVLQAGLGSIKLGATSFSLVLIPIVIGSCVIGPIAGGILGFVFSFIVFLFGVFGADLFTYVMFTANPWATTLIIFSKGILAGVVPGVLFNLICKKSEKAGIITASLSAPIVNTAIFALLSLAFSSSFVTAFMKNGFMGDAEAFTHFIFIGCAGVNFLVELCVNAIATPLFFTVIRMVGKNK